MAQTKSEQVRESIAAAFHTWMWAIGEHGHNMPSRLSNDFKQVVAKRDEVLAYIHQLEERCGEQ